MQTVKLLSFLSSFEWKLAKKGSVFSAQKMFFLAFSVFAKLAFQLLMVKAINVSINLSHYLNN